jgi:hypothetical protein
VEAYRIHLENDIKKWIESSRDAPAYRDLLVIDVVVHVVWNEADEMISEQQVLSQIEVLNEDYRLLNASFDLVTFPLFVAVAADMEIEFQLATVDPMGNPTSGINYVQTEIENIASEYSGGKRRICHESLGGADGWCNHHYLNIWVGAFEGGILGEASFPGQEFNYPEEDGIRIATRAFGRTPNLEEPYHLGRTLTHEIGHYFNLKHPWGDSDDDPPNLDCTGDDGVADTPKQAFNYKNTCFTSIHQSCGTPDMHFNFMNYTDDACMALFTQQQKLHAVASIALSRPGLLNASGCSVAVDALISKDLVKLFPNPVSDALQVQLLADSETTFLFEIFDISGRKINKDVFLKYGNNTVSLGNLENGFYLVKISNQEHLLIEKITVAR